MHQKQHVVDYRKYVLCHVHKCNKESLIYPFDPMWHHYQNDVLDANIHQPIEMVQTDKNSLDHTVSAVIQKGYKLGERVMRPARVNVYEFKQSTE